LKSDQIDYDNYSFNCQLPLRLIVVAVAFLIARVIIGFGNNFRFAVVVFIAALRISPVVDLFTGAGTNNYGFSDR
jgi:hypothetical protein